MIITGTRVRGGKYYGGTASAVTTDEYFNLVSLLLPGNGTNGQTNNTFLDSSTNAFTITRNGNTTQGTFSPFSQTGWSNYFDGSSDHLLVAASTGSWGDFGTGDFTIEAWIYTPAVSALQGICGAHTGGQNDTWQFRLNGSTLELFGANGQACAATTAVSANQWVFVTVSRSGANAYLGVNGTVNTVAITAGVNGLFSATSGGNVSVANLYSTPSAYWFTGYISNLRIRKGTAAYTSSFTPPTAALTAISNTQLLTCQSNRFIDNSTNAFAITVAGNTAVQAFSPFDPVTAYAAGTVGGSAYFDGTGDELNAGSQTQFSFGTGAYTVELWVYLTAAVSASHSPGFVVNTTTGGFGFYNDAGTNLTIFQRGVNVVLSSSTTLAANTWNHVVAVRSSTSANQTSIFVNGVRVANGTDPTNWTITGPLVVGGLSLANYYLNGYISSVRVVKGTAVYDPTQSTLTVPTAPLTAVTNTQLLLNYTNAGITDAAAKNIFESINEAQISTAQSKFGGSSIAFDGNADYLTSPVSTLYEFGTGDFTVELWVRFNSTSGTVPMVNLGYGYNGTPLGAYNAWGVVIVNNVFYFSRYLTDGSSNDFTASWTPATNTWYHVAVSRQGTSLRAFIDGTQLGMTQTNSVNYVRVNSDPLYIGQYFAGNTNRYLNGYIDDLRITKGVARYTANFTPPTQAFPTQ